MEETLKQFIKHRFRENGKMLGTLLAEDLLLTREPRLDALRRTFGLFFNDPITVTENGPDYNGLLRKGMQASILDNSGYPGALLTFVEYVRTLSFKQLKELRDAFNKRVDTEEVNATGFFNLCLLDDVASVLHCSNLVSCSTENTKIDTVVPSPDWPVEQLVELRLLARWYDPYMHWDVLWWPPLPTEGDPALIERWSHVPEEVYTASEARYQTELRAVRKKGSEQA